jgi:hypothetical protein
MVRYRCISAFTVFHQFNSLHNQAPHLSVVRLMTIFSSQLRPIPSVETFKLKLSKAVVPKVCSVDPKGYATSS